MRARAVLSILAVAVILASSARSRGDEVLAPSPIRVDAPGLVGVTLTKEDIARTLSARDGRRSGFEAVPTAEVGPGELGVHEPLGRLGDGGAADVADLVLWQVAYGDEQSGNVVRVIWTENTFNPPQTVRVFVDDVEVGIFDGAPEDQLPTQRSVDVPDVEAGLRTISVQADGDGSFIEGQIVVLDEQPFADPFDFRCDAGGVNEETGDCHFVLRFRSIAAFPTRYVVLLTVADVGTFLLSDNVGPAVTQITITGMTAGENCLVVIPFLDTPEGIYRGGVFETCCTLTCEPEPCAAPVSLEFCQTDYEPNSTVELEWVNGELEPSEYVGVNAFVDGTFIGSLAGAPAGAIIAPFPPGEVELGVQGDCGGDVTSDILSGMFTVLAESPHKKPFTGTVECDYDGAVLTASWTNNPEAPSSTIDVFLTPGGDEDNAVYQGFLLGDAESVGIAAGPNDGILLQFRTWIDGACHSSPRFGCGDGETGNSFIRGICNGAVSDPENPTPQITSAIFLFNFLFLGGPIPPCMEACNVDGEGEVNLTDGVYLLNFLFLSGPAPLGWIDNDGDGFGDPICELAPEENCATSAEYCP